MGHGEEPRMDELKKLLRRLDGLDGNKSLAKTAQQADSQQRGYVGALRGAPVGGGRDEAAPAEDTGKGRSSRSAMYVAALTAALISTVSVYLMMTWQATTPQRATGPAPSKPVVPSTFDPDAPGAGGSDARGGSTRMPQDLVRQAERQALTAGEGAARESGPAPGGRDF